MITLRSYILLDSLQPQLAAHICTTCKGFFPIPEVASLFVEVAPGMSIHKYLNAALKQTKTDPGTLIIERAYGMLELHHENKGEVIEAGNVILREMNQKITDRIKPKIISNTIIRSIEPMHAMIINKIRFGSMIKPGQSLYILETEPAGYIALAANQAEKRTNIDLIEIRAFGAFGRLYMCGQESEIDEAAQAALSAIKYIN